MDRFLRDCYVTSRGAGGGGFGGGSRSSYSSSSYGSSSRSSYGSSSPSSSYSSSRYSAPSPSYGSSSSSGSYRSPAATSYGSSTGSGGGYRAPAASSGTRTQYGGSAASGGASRGSTGNARPNYGSVGASAERSSVNRPAANAPRAAQSPAVQPTYNTHYTTVNNYGGVGHSGFGTGSLLLAGAGGMVGGYMLGSMIANSHRDYYGCCYGCGCSYYGAPPPYYYDSYVPYRYRYADQTSTTTVAPSAAAAGVTTTVAPAKPIEVCTLARWNMELPFTEMPNMLLTFLANDNVSGSSVAEKSQFVKTFFNTTAGSYGQLNPSSNVFTIPSAYDLSICNFDIEKPGGAAGISPVAIGVTNSSINATGVSVTDATVTLAPTTAVPWFGGILLDNLREKVRNGDRGPCVTFSFAHIPECESDKPKVEEPFRTAVRQMLHLYGNSTTDQDMIGEVVASAKRCYPVGVTPPAEIRPCLDYSISSDQATSLQNQTSLFNNDEVCKKYLNPDISKCITKDSTFPCKVSDLVNLNVFARNYYLCSEPVDPALIDALNNINVAKSANDNTPALSGTINTGGQSGSQGQRSHADVLRTGVWPFFVIMLLASLSWFL